MWRQLLVRSAIITVVSITVTAGSIFAIITYQDWSTNRPIAEPDSGPPLGPANLPSPESFSPTVSVPPAPMVTDIKIVSADEIRDEIADDDLVLGVEIDGKSRAYSINMMTGPSREIFNDTLAGRPIAATW